jgi:hypothetical protein
VQFDERRPKRQSRRKRLYGIERLLKPATRKPVGAAAA